MARRKWNGLCSAGLHGLDFEGQPCDLCQPDDPTKLPPHLAASLPYGELPRERPYCVECSECGAVPREHCVTVGGRSCKPHGKRIARANGLRPTPRRGMFSKPPGGIEFTEAELEAFRVLGHEIPK